MNPIDPLFFDLYAPSPSQVGFSSSNVVQYPPSPEMEMEIRVRAVEKIVGYSFKDKRLIEEALTHSSYPDKLSYQRLEFIGDAALGLAISNYVYLAYPNLDPGHLSLIRAANISTEKLARVAVRHNLYRFVRHNAAYLFDKVPFSMVCLRTQIESLLVYLVS